MTFILRQAMALLEPGERRRLHILLVLSAIAAILQAVAILAIMPFIVLLANPDLLASSELLQRVYDLSGATSYAGFLTLFGIFGLVMLTLGNSILALEDWLSLRYVCLLGHRMETQVLTHMLEQPYEQHVKQHSGRMADVVLVQVERVVDGVIGSFIATFGNAALTLFIVVMLLMVSFQTTLVTLVLLFFAYLGVFLLLRRRIETHGEALTRLSGNASSHVREMLDGIREIKTRQAEGYFAKRFGQSNLEISLLGVRFGVLSFLPNFILETLVFGGLIAVALFFMVATENSGLALAYIALYGMAIYRLVPALKSIFEGISDMHHHADAIRIVREHIDLAETDVPQLPISPPQVSIGLVGVSYAYTEDRNVSNIDLVIPAGSSLCLFGPSGAGKTTLLNLIAALLYPAAGDVVCDDTPLGPQHRDAWRSMIGYCPQQVFLFDDSVASNIAFGVPKRMIDLDRVRHVAELAMIRSFIEESLEHGFDTVIGEDGKTLSGGQQQRIGIARCLYHDPAVLLLDESFTGLDAANKDAILENVFQLPHKTRVLSTHEADIARRCDRVALMVGGKIVACDSYDALSDEIIRYAAEA